MVQWQGLKGTKLPQAHSVRAKLFMLLKTSGQRWGEGGETGQERKLTALYVCRYTFLENQLVTKMLSAKIQTNFKPAKPLTCSGCLKMCQAENYAPFI